MKKCLKFVFVVFISIASLFLFSNKVKASMTCKTTKKSNYEVVFQAYDTLDSDKVGEIRIKLDSSTLKISSLYVCGKTLVVDGLNVSSYDLTTKKSFDCDIDGSGHHTVSFGTVNLSEKFYALSDTVGCSADYPSTINITGLTNASEKATSGAVSCDYSFVMHKGESNEKKCVVTIQQDAADGDVVMKYGSESGVKETKTNPTKGTYECNVDGEAGKFTLEKNMTKGSLKSNSDCPTVTPSSNFTSSQTPTIVQGQTIDKTTSDSPTSEKGGRRSHISINNVFQVVTNKITCNSALSHTMPILKDIFKYVRIGAVLLFIVLTSVDYIGAITSSDQTGFQKANKHVVSRAITLVIILILPSIINVVLAIVQIKDGACGLN